MKFKVGDRVRRIADDHAGMVVGDTATVIEVHRMSLELDKYRGTHSGRKFEIIDTSVYLPEDLFIL